MTAAPRAKSLRGEPARPAVCPDTSAPGLLPTERRASQPASPWQCPGHMEEKEQVITVVTGGYDDWCGFCRTGGDTSSKVFCR